MTPLTNQAIFHRDKQLMGGLRNTARSHTLDNVSIKKLANLYSTYEYSAFFLDLECLWIKTIPILRYVTRKLTSIQQY